jgi:tol-pal system protein YbgF
MKKTSIAKCAALLGSVILTAAGCTGTRPVIVGDSASTVTSIDYRQIQRLAKNIDAVAKQMHNIEKRLDSLEKLEEGLEYMGKLEMRLDSLQETVERSEQMALRNQSLINELRDNLSTIEGKRITTPGDEQTVKISTQGLSQEKLYLTAYQEYLSGNYTQAIELFSSYLVSYPESRLADNALYWVGEAYYKLEDFSRAIRHLKKVAKKYPQANKAPYALYRLGLVYQQLGDNSSAKAQFQRLKENYSQSELAGLAQVKVEKLQ